VSLHSSAIPHEREDGERANLRALVAELKRTNDELKRRLAQGVVDRDEVVRDEARADVTRAKAGEAQLRLHAADLKRQLAERSIERDDVARNEALVELTRTDVELKQRLAERTIERDDVARDEALIEIARTNDELKRQLAERTIERDGVARDDAVVELARTNDELKQRLAERTTERDEIAREKALIELARTDMVEELLRVHSTELEVINGELESFSYSVSHDLRSPVRAILGYTRSIEDDYGAQFDAEGRRLLSVVVGEASRMGDLIDDLLAFSQLGRQPMVSVPVNMLTLARDVATEEATAAGLRPSARRIDIRCHARGGARSDTRADHGIP